LIALLLARVFLLADLESPAFWKEPATGMEFVLIHAGSFSAGVPADRPRPRFLHSFYLARFEVTQGEWRRVMGSNPSHFAECGDRCPVENVNFEDVSAFIKKLNSRSSASLRLPTEAEWEYACRAGTDKEYSTGGALTLHDANFDDGTPRARAGPTPVGSFAPNRWGLSDMHGNVWEWCSDWYRPPSRGDGGLRVIRGGSWHFDAESARCGLRYFHRPQDKGFSLGFRLVRDLPL
jgi:formylglycine-generating enzyme required for sulfatase activity